MKKFALILLALALALPLSAGGGHTVHLFSEAGSNPIGSYVRGGFIAGFWSGKSSMRVGVGREAGQAATELWGRIAFLRVSGNLFTLEPVLINNSHFEYGINEFSAALLGGWESRWLQIKAGVMSKFISGRLSTVAEPWNFAYSVTGWFLSSGAFRLGASLSTIEDFSAERFYCPSFALLSQWQVADRVLLHARIRLHNSGIFDVANNIFDASARIGVTLKW